MKGAGIQAINGQVELLDLAEPPAPTGNQILIDVRAAGIGNWDDLARIGSWNIGISPPMSLGTEAAGTVVSIGPLSSRFAVGDEVLVHSTPLVFQGAWAERFLTREDDVAAKPNAMDWPTAGVLPIPLLTAFELVGLASIGPDDPVLVNGAGGVTGRLIVAAAAGEAARVFATCSPGAARLVRHYGAVETIDYHDGHWADNAKRFAPGGFTLAINAAPGHAAAVLGLVADGGQLVTITGDPPHPERAISVTDFYVKPSGLTLERGASEFVARRFELAIASRGGFELANTLLAKAVAGAAGGANVLIPNT